MVVARKEVSCRFCDVETAVRLVFLTGGSSYERIDACSASIMYVSLDRYGIHGCRLSKPHGLA